MNWEVSQKQGQNPEIFLSGISEWPVTEKDITLKRMGSVVVSRIRKKRYGRSCQAFRGKDHLNTCVLMQKWQRGWGITQWVKYSLYRCEDWSPGSQHPCKCWASMVATYNPSTWVQRQELRLARLAKPMSSGLRKLCLCMERPCFNTRQRVIKGHTYRQPMVPSHTCMGIYM